MDKRVRIAFGIFFVFSLVLNGYFLFSQYRSQIVVSVPDGDTVDLFDGRRVRLLGIDAPEKGRCMSSQARDLLVSLVQGKRVELTNIIKDDYGRQLANIFVGPNFINQVLVARGLARYSSVSSPYANTMKDAFDEAKQESLGIFSSQCRTTTPPSGQCAIKGNIKDGKHIYHTPGCPNYSQVIVDTSYGDSWFCSETEAKTAGFVKASGCK